MKELPFINECACIEYRVKGKPFIKVLVEGEISDAQKQAVISHVAKRMSHWNILDALNVLKNFREPKSEKSI